MERNPETHGLTAEAFHDRRWTLLVLTSIGAFMAPLDGSIVAVALPKMGPALHLSFAATMWVQAAYLLAMAVLLIPMGRLADRRGRVRYYLAGIVVFTLGSLAAALSGNALALILGRVVQGAGAALLSATSGAILTAVFPPNERGKALGLNVMAIYAGLSVGPPLGGFIVQHWSWPWIFLINLPIGAGVLAWGLWFLPREARSTQARHEGLDFQGALLLGLMLVLLLTPLTFASEWGWRVPRIWILLVLAMIAGWGLLQVEKRVREPLLDLDFLKRHRLFAMANLAALLNYLALNAIAILTAVQLQLVQGRSAKTAGWIMLGQPLMQSLLSPFAGGLSDRMGSRILSTSGMVITALGMGLLALMGRNASLVQVIGSLAVVGVGMAAFSAPNTSAIMGSVERDRLSMAGAFLATMRVTGQALSVAILGGIAACRLGSGGWRQLLHGGSPDAASAFAWGYRAAMLTGAGLALLGAWASMTRGAEDVRAKGALGQ